MIERITLISHLASTWAMAGVILVIQIVHYPLFSSVGSTSFSQYEALHTQRITWVVGPLMVIELITAIALVVRPPAGISPELLWAGLSILAVVWLSTVFLQVPLHGQLADGFSEEAYRKLLATNWVRTISWIARGLVVAIALYQYSRSLGTSA